MNIPFCVLGFVGIPVFLRLNHKVGGVFEKLQKFDWVGSVLFVASLTSFLVPLTWGWSLLSGTCLVSLLILNRWCDVRLE